MSLDLEPIKERLATVTPGHWVAGIEIDGGESGYWAPEVVYAVDELPVPSYRWGEDDDADRRANRRMVRRTRTRQYRRHAQLFVDPR